MFIVIAHRSRWRHSSCIIPLQVPQSTDGCWLRKSATLVLLAQPASSSTGLRVSTRTALCSNNCGENTKFCLLPESPKLLFSPQEGLLKFRESFYAALHLSLWLLSSVSPPPPLQCVLNPACVCVLVRGTSDSQLWFSTETLPQWQSVALRSFICVYESLERKKKASFLPWLVAAESKYRCLEGTVICISIEQNNSSVYLWGLWPLQAEVFVLACR